MEDLNIPIFAQAKVEYTKQLVEILYPHMYDGDINNILIFNNIILNNIILKYNLMPIYKYQIGFFYCIFYRNTYTNVHKSKN